KTPGWSASRRLRCFDREMGAHNAARLSRAFQTTQSAKKKAPGKIGSQGGKGRRAFPGAIGGEVIWRDAWGVVESGLSIGLGPLSEAPAEHPCSSEVASWS